MATDFLGGLGGLMKGLTSMMPQDDPGVKLLNAQTEVSDLQKQEAEILVDIGRQAFAEAPDIYPQADKLRLIRANIADAENRLSALKREQEAAEQVKEAERQAKEAEQQAQSAALSAAEAASLCPGCGTQNPMGVKFCQECGTKLGAVACVACGAELKAGARFCGECGAKQGE